MQTDHDGAIDSAWNRFLGEVSIWRLAPAAVAALVVVPLAAQVLAAAWLVADETSFLALTDEDGSLEWLQFFALAIAGATFLGVARNEWRRGARIVAALAVIAAIGSAFVAAEEISWGQRVLGIATPEGLRDVNVQGESNLHNLAGLEVIVRGAQMGAASYAVIMPLAALAFERYFLRIDRLLIPPVATIGFLLPLVIYWLLRLPLVPSSTMSRFSEIPETSAYLGLALVAWFNLRRVRSRRRAEAK